MEIRDSLIPNRTESSIRYRSLGPTQVIPQTAKRSSWREHCRRLIYPVGFRGSVTQFREIVMLE